jgi:hypothetical protein
MPAALCAGTTNFLIVSCRRLFKFNIREGTQNINVGDLLLTPLPEPIMKKVPKLVGARCTVDRNSAIVVVAPSTNRAGVIIN